MRLREGDGSVFVMESPISQVGDPEIAALREAARTAPRRRARINVHSDDAHLLHEMIIAIARESYVRPHRHLEKSESFHLIEGAVDVVIFNEAGAIMHVISLAARDKKSPFYYRMSQPRYHTLIIRSEMLIVHEVTNGPFRQTATDYAPFAPKEDEVEAVAAYMNELTQRVNAFKATA
jgi:cupin fold WbuC family metalloprotein